MGETVRRGGLPLELTVVAVTGQQGLQYYRLYYID